METQKHGTDSITSNADAGGKYKQYHQVLTIVWGRNVNSGAAHGSINPNNIRPGASRESKSDWELKKNPESCITAYYILQYSRSLDLDTFLQTNRNRVTPRENLGYRPKN